jgi:hypothetical protein
VSSGELIPERAWALAIQKAVEELENHNDSRHLNKLAEQYILIHKHRQINEERYTHPSNIVGLAVNTPSHASPLLD